MEIIIWLGLSLIIAKAILKAVRPDINRYIDNKVKDYWNSLRDYF